MRQNCQPHALGSSRPACRSATAGAIERPATNQSGKRTAPDRITHMSPCSPPQPPSPPATRADAKCSVTSSRRKCPASSAALARRTRSADLRQYLGRSLEALGRADEDDPQRVPPDAVAEGGAGTRRRSTWKISSSAKARRFRPGTSRSRPSKLVRPARPPAIGAAIVELEPRRARASSAPTDRGRRRGPRAKMNPR